MIARVVDVRCLGRGGERNVRVMESGLVEREEVVKVLRKMKCGIVAGVKGNSLEIHKNGVTVLLNG